MSELTYTRDDLKPRFDGLDDRKKCLACRRTFERVRDYHVAQNQIMTNHGLHKTDGTVLGQKSPLDRDRHLRAGR